jgi:hypothetical protein
MGRNHAEIDFNKCPECRQPGKCFAKRPANSDPRKTVCIALCETYPIGHKCPFQKEHRLD